MPLPSTRAVALVLFLAVPVAAAPAEARKPVDTVPREAPELFRALGAQLPVAVSDATAEGVHPNLHMVTLTLALADDDPVTVYVPSGGMATYRSNRYDYMVGVIPRVTDAETGRVSIDVIEISGTRNARKAERVVDTIEGTIGFPDVTAAHRGLPLMLEVVKSKPMSSETAGRCLAASSIGFGGIEEMRNVGFGNGCCVSCGDGETCGCIVFSSCGSCCGECGGC